VLDNCGRRVEACAEFASGLLQRVPGLRILATSREPLNIPGERVWRVPPLQVPEPGRIVAAADLAECTAVQLFVERASAIEAGFALRPDNAAAVAGICSRLGGLPLALE